MKIVIGLGNPGIEHLGARHNAGAAFVDMLSDKLGSEIGSDYGWRKKKDILVWESNDRNWLLVKTNGIFMNESGRMAREALANRQWKKEDLYLVHDDLDIKLGEYKIQLGTGPKDHNGVNSVEQALGIKDFWRIRIGIDNRQTPANGETYVLQKFTSGEKETVGEVENRIIKEITEGGV